MPRSLQEILDQAEILSARFEDGFEPDVNPQIAALRAAVHRRSQAEADIAAAVSEAIGSGATWAAVGGAVGTSGQAARERYKPVINAPERSGAHRRRADSTGVSEVSGKVVQRPAAAGPSGEESAVPDGDIHTSKQGDVWVNKAEGNTRASNTAATKAEAQAKGREMAIERNVEHVIHNKDGKIGERNTYPRSRDPRSSKG